MGYTNRKRILYFRFSQRLLCVIICQCKGNLSWIFIGRTDAEAEAPILWPPDMKNWLIGKDPDAGKEWRQEEKRMTEDETVGCHHQLDGHEFEQALGVGDGPRSLACYIQSMGSQRVGYDWTTELTDTSMLLYIITLQKNIEFQLFWWSSGWESAFQCKGHCFGPWSRKIPHATGQLSPRTTTTEPGSRAPDMY